MALYYVNIEGSRTHPYSTYQTGASSFGDLHRSVTFNSGDIVEIRQSTSATDDTSYAASAIDVDITIRPMTSESFDGDVQILVPPTGHYLYFTNTSGTNIQDLSFTKDGAVIMLNFINCLSAFDMTISGCTFNNINFTAVSPGVDSIDIQSYFENCNISYNNSNVGFYFIMSFNCLNIYDNIITNNVITNKSVDCMSFYASNISGCDISNNTFENNDTASNCIYFDRYLSTGNFLNNTILNNTTDGVNSSFFFANPTYAEELTIAHNQSLNTSGHHIAFDTDATHDTIRDLFIYDNELSGISNRAENNGIVVSAASLENVHVYNNKIDKCDYGIFFHTDDSVSDMNIFDNEITNAYNDGLKIVASYSVSGANFIRNNHFKTCNGDGIHLNVWASVNYAAIYGNYFRSMGQKAINIDAEYGDLTTYIAYNKIESSDGIYIRHDPDGIEFTTRVSIFENIIGVTTYGIRIITPHFLSYPYIINNTIIDSTYGISFECEKISNAQILNNCISGTYTGIYFDYWSATGTNSADYNLIYDSVNYDYNFSTSALGTSFSAEGGNNLYTDPVISVENLYTPLPTEEKSEYSITSASPCYSNGVSATATGYNTDIGAIFVPKTYYVDLNKTSADTGDGSLTDPYSYMGFILLIEDNVGDVRLRNDDVIKVSGSLDTGSDAVKGTMSQDFFNMELGKAVIIESWGNNPWFIDNIHIKNSSDVGKIIINGLVTDELIIDNETYIV